MCGARIAAADDAAVADGTARHRATDAAFHRPLAVTGLMRELDEELQRASCARGRRRAVAYIEVGGVAFSPDSASLVVSADAPAKQIERFSVSMTP